ncbi:MAG: Outer membrane protein assembly factor BamB [Ignavibacteriaceae bacterium]|nr:Outer membrane protein assembly factor BamB [Ignavibacteriaceae bacterium]
MIIFHSLFKYDTEEIMINKILMSLLLSGLVYSQQQIDIPWPTLANSPWPMVKHDPQFTGRSPYKGPQSATIWWEKDMEYGIFSGPVIGEDRDVYFGSYYVYADNFYSYSNSGDLNWVYESGSNRSTASGIIIDSSNTIYFGSRDSCLYALNPDGTFKWKYKTSGFIVQEVIPNIDLVGNIYITNFIFDPTEPDRGEFYCIKPNGTLNWKVMYDNGFAFKSPVFSPDGNTIYIAGVDSNLFALNLDGSIKWKFSCGNVLRSPMVDSNGNIYFIPKEIPQYLYSLMPDGNVRWQYFIQDIGSLDLYSIPAIDTKGNIYAIALDTTCCAYNHMLISLDYDGIIRWKYIFQDYETDDFWQPLICDSEGTVYVGSTNGYCYYAISSSGELMWRLPLYEQPQQVDNTGAIADDGTLYLGVHNASILQGQIKTLLAIRDTVTSVPIGNASDLRYSLKQNYPNPFNSLTHIRYSIIKSSNVLLKVFDILGNEVATLVNVYQNLGEYDVLFEANDLSSGIYFYTLSSGNFTATKKLILLK